MGAFAARAGELELEFDKFEGEKDYEVLLWLITVGFTFAASKALTVGKLGTDEIENEELVLRVTGGFWATCNLLFAGVV